MSAANSSQSVSKYIYMGVPVVAGTVSIGLYIWSLVSTTSFLGSKDDWNSIKPQVTKVLILTLIGTFLFGIAALIYFIGNPVSAVYFAVIISSLSLGIAYSSLAVAAISR
jgi:hypothetical protein